MSKQKYKASMFNHFVENEDGKILAFNALACGLGQMDKTNYDIYKKIVNVEITDYSEVPQDFFEKLKAGNYIVPVTRDEIRNLKASHYISRFGNQGLGLTIIPTLECNFACDYCYQPDNPDVDRDPKREVMKKEIQDSIVEMVKSRIQPKASLSISWYGGEPLLRLDVIEYLTERFKDTCKEKEVRYNATIITNGYLLTPEVQKKLIELDISFAQVTLDGPEEMHNKRRPLVGGGSTFQTILNNLERIPEDEKFHVSIRVNVDNRNRDHVLGLFHQLKQRNFHKRKNIGVYLSQVHTDNYACNDIRENCIITREFATYDLRLLQKTVELGFKVSQYPAVMIASCAAITPNSFVIEADGTLHACWDTVGRDEMCIGKLDGTILKMNDNYSKWLSYSPFDNKQCTECSILPMCMGGCPYRSIYKDKLSVDERRGCLIWKYNLKDRMKFFVEAFKMGLFIPPKRKKYI